MYGRLRSGLVALSVFAYSSDQGPVRAVVGFVVRIRVGLGLGGWFGISGEPGRHRCEPGWGGSGDELECLAVGRADNGEVAVVQRRDRGDSEAFPDGDDARVYEPEAKVGVGSDEVDATLVAE